MKKYLRALAAGLLAVSMSASAVEQGWRYGGFEHSSGNGWAYGSFAYDEAPPSGPSIGALRYHSSQDE